MQRCMPNHAPAGNGAIARLCHTGRTYRAVPEQFLHLCQYRPGAWFKPVENHTEGVKFPSGPADLPLILPAS